MIQHFIIAGNLAETPKKHTFEEDGAESIVLYVKTEEEVFQIYAFAQDLQEKGISMHKGQAVTVTGHIYSRACKVIPGEYSHSYILVATTIEK